MCVCYVQDVYVYIQVFMNMYTITSTCIYICTYVTYNMCIYVFPVPQCFESKGPCPLIHQFISYCFVK